ncbi:MAG: ThiF family adenylyltransferase [Eggerthellaceae bacterium]
MVAHDAFVTADNVGDFLEDSVDFIVDAVDTVTTKLALASYAEKRGIAFVGSMGAANKCHPEMLAFADIYQTQSCPLCRSVRKLARKQGIKRCVCCTRRAARCRRGGRRLDAPRKDRARHAFFHAPYHGADDRWRCDTEHCRHCITLMLGVCSEQDGAFRTCGRARYERRRDERWRRASCR